MSNAERESQQLLILLQACCPQTPLSILSDRALVHRILLTDPERLHTLTVSGKPRMLQTPSYSDFCASLDSNQYDNSSSNNTATSSTTTAGVVATTGDDLSALVNGAFRQEICQRINQSHSLAPAHDLLLELHDMLRNLIPSRRDLHKLLDEEAVVHNKTHSSITSILLLVIQAAQGLQALESEARAASTNEWIQSVNIKIHHSDDKDKQENGKNEFNIYNPEAVSYLVTSMLYLMLKAELCQMDKQDFYLSHVWAPQIVRKGPELERIGFETEFGSSLSSKYSSSTAPATRTWIRRLMENARKQQKQQQQQHDWLAGLSQSVEQRCNLVRVGWVDSLLFHSLAPPPDDGSDSSAAEKQLLLLPEIFALDQGNIQAIRRITKLAAAGSALALHACQVAGQPVSVLNSSNIQLLEPLAAAAAAASSTSPIQLRRTALVRAISEQWKLQHLYEQDVTSAVVALAMEWRKSSSSSSLPASRAPLVDQDAIDILCRRTTSVLQGQDPVFQLLDGRMKECFRQVVLMLARPGLAVANNLSSFPTKLQTGRRGGTTTTTMTTTGMARTSTDDIANKKVHDLFCSRGLSFYALELTMAAKMASNIVELALDVYGGNVLMDRIILEECSS